MRGSPAAERDALNRVGSIPARAGEPHGSPLAAYRHIYPLPAALGFDGAAELVGVHSARGRGGLGHSACSMHSCTNVAARRCSGLTLHVDAAFLAVDLTV